MRTVFSRRVGGVVVGVEWRRAIASGAVACTAAVGLVAFGQSSAHAAACAETRSSTISLSGIANESEFLTHYTTGGQVVVDPRTDLRSNVDTGSASATILACKDPNTNRWAPLTYNVGTNLRDLNLTVEGETVTPLPANGEGGYGVMIGGVTPDRVEIQPLVCWRKPTKASFRSVAKLVTGLPIPAPAPVAVGKAIIHKAIPAEEATYACELLPGDTAVPWSLSDQGEARLVMPASGNYLYTQRATWTETGCADRYCGTSHDQTLVVRAGT